MDLVDDLGPFWKASVDTTGDLAIFWARQGQGVIPESKTDMNARVKQIKNQLLLK